MARGTRERGIRIVRDAGISLMVIGAALVALALPARARAAVTCARTVTADVVVFDQPLMYNRLGAQNVNGIIYALRRDVVPLGSATTLAPGQVTLRPDKRPRPLVLRVAAGDCLTVNFQNLLAPNANTTNPPADFTLPPVNAQVASRMAGFHAQGLQLDRQHRRRRLLRGAGTARASWPREARRRTATSPRRRAPSWSPATAPAFGSDGSAGNSANGMFAVVNVEPKGASFYRSQVSEEEMRLCSTGTTAAGQPVIDYECTYPTGPASAVPAVATSGATLAGALFLPVAQDPPRSSPRSRRAGSCRSSRPRVRRWSSPTPSNPAAPAGFTITDARRRPGRLAGGDSGPERRRRRGRAAVQFPNVWALEGKAGPSRPQHAAGRPARPLRPERRRGGPGAGRDLRPAATYPLESKGLRNPSLPTRLEPFREYTVVFHDEMAVANAFPLWYLDPVLKHTLAAVGDVFQVNYGSGGVGSEVIANRLGVGPMHDCLDCVYEEFFLTSSGRGRSGHGGGRPGQRRAGGLRAPGHRPGLRRAAAPRPRAPTTRTTRPTSTTATSATS